MIIYDILDKVCINRMSKETRCGIVGCSCERNFEITTL